MVPVNNFCGRTHAERPYNQEPPKRPEVFVEEVEECHARLLHTVMR